jgi:NADH-quinone oxidoreductase subunit J
MGDIILFLFTILKYITILCALLVVNVRNPVHSVLFLIMVFINVSCILLLFGLEFLAFVYLMVYVGAIAVLFLFVVMMLDITTSTKTEKHPFFILAVFIVFCLLACELGLSVRGSFSLREPIYFYYAPVPYSLTDLVDAPSNLAAIGVLLFTKNFFPFLLSTSILLVSMLGAILLTLAHSQGVRRTDIYLQNFASSRVRLMIIKSNHKPKI